MNKVELNTINKHLEDKQSNWFNILARYTDGTILIRHGSHNRAYNKVLKIKESEGK